MGLGLDEASQRVQRMGFQHGVTCLFVFCVCLLSVKTEVDARLKRDIFDERKDTIGTQRGPLPISIEITIENLTNLKLLNFQYFTVNGKLQKTPMLIYPNSIVKLKTLSGMTRLSRGTRGVLSWEIEGHDTRLIVMWKLKAKRNRDSKNKNTLWIALVRTSDFAIEDWENLLMYEAHTKLQFEKRTFVEGRKVKPIKIGYHPFILEGIMGTGDHPKITVTLSFIEQEKALFQTRLL